MTRTDQFTNDFEASYILQNIHYIGFSHTPLTFSQLSVSDTMRQMSQHLRIYSPWCWNECRSIYQNTAPSGELHANHRREALTASVECGNYIDNNWKKQRVPRYTAINNIRHYIKTLPSHSSIQPTDKLEMGKCKLFKLNYNIMSVGQLCPLTTT